METVSEMAVVNLIASGYDWQCPHCEQDEKDEFNHVIEIPSDNLVTCPICNVTCYVGEIFEANE